MKKIIFTFVATTAAAGTLLVPNTAVANTCFMTLQEDLASCNGDQVCEQFAYWDYDDCMRSESGGWGGGGG